MDPASVAAALRISPTPPSTSSGTTPARMLTGSRRSAHWQPDTLYVLTVADTARAARRRPPRRPRPRRRPDRARPARRTIAATRATGGRRPLDSGVPDHPRSSRRPRGRPGRPCASSPCSPVGVTAGATTASSCSRPRSARRQRAPTPSRLDGLVDADGVALRRVPRARGRGPRRRPRWSASGPCAGQKRVPRTAAVSVRFTERMDREADGRRVPASCRPARPWRATARWAEQRHGPRVRPRRAPPVRRQGPGAGRRRRLVPGRHRRSRRDDRPCSPWSPSPSPSPPAPSPPAAATAAVATAAVAGGGGGPAVAASGGRRRMRRRLRRWRRRERQLGGRRVVLPAPDELHPDRWLGHGRRPVLVARRARRRRRSGCTAAISARVARPYAKLLADPQHLRPLRRRATRATACAAPATRATAGRRTWAAGRATRTPPSWARTATSRARGRTTAATTVNIMNSAYRYVGIGVWVSGGRVRLVVDFYTP